MNRTVLCLLGILAIAACQSPNLTPSTIPSPIATPTLPPSPIPVPIPTPIVTPSPTPIPTPVPTVMPTPKPSPLPLPSAIPPSMTYNVVVQGEAKQGNLPPFNRLLLSEEDLNLTWEELFPNTSAVGGETPSPTSEIDFSNDIGALIYLGSRPNPSYQIEVFAVEEREEGVTIHYREKAPAAGTSQSLGHPYTLIKFQRPNKPITFKGP